MTGDTNHCDVEPGGKNVKLGKGVLKKTSTDPDNAEEIVARIAAGDREAETVLYQRYGPAVLFMLRQRCGDAMLAEDLHHETFRIVIERLRNQSLDKPERLPAYLHRVAINLAIGEIRKAQRRNTQADSGIVSEAIARQPDVVDVIDRESRADAVRHLLQEMAVARDRELLSLYFIEEKDKPTICRQLGLTSAHFDRVFYRAKRRFRTIIEKTGKKFM